MGKILVIEDNKEVRENLAEILELAGYDVLTAPHGKGGVELAVRELPDLVLCDIMMPELDGFGVLKILRGNKRTMDIPFIFLTAKSEKQDFRRGMGLGADDYISKPFDDVELLQTIEFRLEKSERIKHHFDMPHSFHGKKPVIKLVIDKLVENQSVTRIHSKQVLFEEENPVKNLYYIKEGFVKGLKYSESGKVLITEIFRPGDLIGIEDMLSAKKHCTSAVTLTDSEIVLIGLASVQEKLAMDRELAACLIELISTRLRMSYQRMVSFTYDSVRKRIADALVSLSVEPPQSVDHQATIELSREDLASLAGTAKETVIRTLSDFRDEGLITTNARKITLINPNKLRQMPN